MGKILKVALAGATGRLGPVALKQLLKDGFTVTILSRSSSNEPDTDSVKHVKVDYTSIESLTSALQGQDAVVSTMASAAAGQQLLLVQAALIANVKHFIPSEFGTNVENEASAVFPPFREKIAVQNALKEAAKTSSLSYTFICTGPFLDLGIHGGVIMNLSQKRIDLWDGGHRPFSTTTMATISKAISGVLSHLEETANRAVFVQDIGISLRKMVDLAKQVTGSDSWEENLPSTTEALEQGWEEIKKESPNLRIAVGNFLKVATYGEGYGSHFLRLDNELLGLKEMSDEDLLSLFRSA